jgi:integrase
MANAHLNWSRQPAIVAPRRGKNAEYRTREHLTESEVERLIEAVKGNRNGHRDATMILVCYRHGLRAAELCDLRWDQVEFETGRLHVRRRKNGTPSVHPLSGRELRALRKLGIFRSVGKALASDYVPEQLRASGVGWYNTTVGLCGLIASLVAGWLWDQAGHATVFLFGAAFAVVGSIALLALVPANPKHDAAVGR